MSRPTKGVKFGPFSPRRFDVRRNWALVRALLEDPLIQVQYLFCNQRLKEAMLEHLPREILHRRKQGYSLPIKNWLRTELRDYARAEIRQSELVQQVFEPAALERIWEEHLSRRHNHNHLLWAALNLALWHRRFFGGRRAVAAA